MLYPAELRRHLRQCRLKHSYYTIFALKKQMKSQAKRIRFCLTGEASDTILIGNILPIQKESDCVIKNEWFGEGVSLDGMPPPFFLIGLINEFNNRFQAAGDAFFKKISWKQCFALNCITFFDEPPTVRQLAELIGCSHQNTKQLLTKLEKSGYVRILPDSMDKRKRRIVLTEQTHRLRREYEEASTGFMERLFSGVSPQEAEAAIQVITKLHLNLKGLTEELR